MFGAVRGDKPAIAAMGRHGDILGDEGYIQLYDLVPLRARVRPRFEAQRRTELDAGKFLLQQENPAMVAVSDLLELFCRKECFQDPEIGSREAADLKACGETVLSSIHSHLRDRDNPADYNHNAQHEHLFQRTYDVIAHLMI